MSGIEQAAVSEDRSCGHALELAIRRADTDRAGPGIPLAVRFTNPFPNRPSRPASIQDRRHEFQRRLSFGPERLATQIRHSVMTPLGPGGNESATG